MHRGVDRLSKTWRAFREKRGHFQAVGAPGSGQASQGRRPEGTSGFGNVKVCGKARWVLTVMNNKLGGEFEKELEAPGVYAE